jgi:hypothetical protein
MSSASWGRCWFVDLNEVIEFGLLLQIRGFPTSTIPSMIASSSSPIAAGSVWGQKRLTSAPSLPVRLSVSRRFRMTSGSSASWSMILVTSIWRRVYWNR